MTAEEIIKGMIEESNKDMTSSEKKKIYEGIEKLLGQGFSCIVLATNKGNIVVGNKYSIMSAIGMSLGELYQKDQLSKKDLENIIEAVIEISNEKNKQSETDELMKKLDESLKKLFN